MSRVDSSNEKHTAQIEGHGGDLSTQYGGGHIGSWVGYLPESWVPYVQLARLSPPAGLFLIYFPHIFGVVNSAIVQRSPNTDVFYTCVLLLGGSFFFSNAAHSWNDLIDAPFDRQVTRTRKRPIARGAISSRGAFVFTVSQALCASVFLLILPPGTALNTAPNMIGTAYYPWAKRHTNMAQMVLGLCLAWGVIVGASATGVDPWSSSSTLSLFLACISWTGIYDTIYAHQDLQDDVKVGLKSFAVLFRERAKLLLWFLLGCMAAALFACGYFGGMGRQYYIVAPGGCLVSIGVMIGSVDLGSSSSCWWWFRYGFWLPAWSILVGLIFEYLRVLS